MLGFIRSAINRIAQQVEARTRTWSDHSLADWFGGWSTKSASGVVVTHDTAMRNNAIFCCVRVLSDGVAMLPLKLYRKMRPRGKEEAVGHPLWRVLHKKANPLMTSYTFRHTMTGWRVRTGNAYAEKVFAGNGQVAQLWPIPSTLVEPTVLDTGELVYDVTVPGEAKRQRLPRERVLHWRGWSPDGIVGYDPITLHREAIAIGLSVEEYQARFFGNGSRPGGVIQVEGVLGDTGRKRLKAGWEAAHGGLAQAHRVAVLENGAKWQQISINPAEAQMMEAEKWNRRKIAAAFGVPLHRIQDIENASYATLEQQDREFMVHSLGPLLESLEAELDVNVIAELEQDEYFAEHVMSAVLRGDFAARVDGYTKLWNIGTICGDDIREMENMNPLPEQKGQDYIMPLNVQAIPAGGVAAKQAAREAALLGADGSVQDTALNGAQVTSLFEIVAGVASGSMPADSAIAMILVAFPGVSSEEAKKMIEPAAKKADERNPETESPAPQPDPEQPPPMPADA